MLLSAGNFAVYRAESQVFNILEPRFGDLSVDRHRRALLTAWYASPLFVKTGLSSDEIDERVMSQCQNGGDFLREVMEAVARKQGVARWADCTPEHLLYVKRIKETIPNALIIHVLRDGRDVSLSLEKQRWIKPFRWDRGRDLAVAALYWDWIVRRGRAAGRSLGQDYLEVQYEDLVRDPRASLATIGRFVEQPLDYERIQQVAIGAVSQPNTSFASDLLGGQPFQPVARWRQGMSESEQAVLDALVGDTLEVLGYETDNVAHAPQHRGSLHRMRSLYQTYFSAKLLLKTRTAVGRALVSRDLSWA
jgi:Sulfotransferase family